MRKQNYLKCHKIKHNIFRLNNTNIQNLKNNLETYLNDNYFIQAANELRLVLIQVMH